MAVLRVGDAWLVGFGVRAPHGITWFHLSYDMVSRRIYKLSFYGDGTPSGGCVVGRGVGKRARHGFRCFWLVSPLGSLDKDSKLLYNISLHRVLENRHNWAK